MDDLRQKARTWIAENLPEGWHSASAETHGEEAFYDIRTQWAQKLHDGRWLGLSWPRAFGGQELSLYDEVMFAEELAAARAPDFINRNTVFYIGPTLIAHATEEQKHRHLPRLLSAEDIWCQGYSEPNAGSDLASLQTSAVRKGDKFIVSGQKVWITLGTHANWCYLLARTNPEEPRHRGISAFIVDMKSPGVSARPITTITGSHEFAEVFFDEVEVPAENILGELNQGWKVAMTTLGNERSINFFARALHFRQEVREVAALARRVQRGGRPAISDVAIAREIACCAEEAEALRLTMYRYLPQWAKSRLPGAESSVLKVMWSEAHQRLTRVALEVLGPLGQLRIDEASEDRGRWPHAYLAARAETIYAGTSEVQRNVIAQRFLGLPRPPA